MPILVLGGDGYLGWPLAIKLALREPRERIVLVDNLLRRKLVAEAGGNSVTPILPPDERIAAFRRIFGQDNISFIEADVATHAVDSIIGELMPHRIYHLAQQCSAPWSMRGVEESVFTINNNEGSNMRVLWAVRRHVPDAHLIKLGTFGEYAKGGLDIPEGYFLPSHGGKTATEPLPYPRASDDVYHISKINDTNYISLACRKWGLRVTDVMQSTIFGVFTAETRTHVELYTRFDYDAIFGTVVNRFITQVVRGLPMTVYGTGLQRSGLMALEDSLDSLVQLGGMPADPGQHRVINHVTERNYCINEIAARIQAVAATFGHDAQILQGVYNPRRENETVKADYQIEAHYVASHVAHTPFDEVLGPMFATAERFRDRINPAAFPPNVSWS